MEYLKGVHGLSIKHGGVKPWMAKLSFQWGASWSNGAGSIFPFFLNKKRGELWMELQTEFPKHMIVGLMGSNGIYPLVNVYITMKNHNFLWNNTPWFETKENHIPQCEFTFWCLRKYSNKLQQTLSPCLAASWNKAKSASTLACLCLFSRVGFELCVNYAYLPMNAGLITMVIHWSMIICHPPSRLLIIVYGHLWLLSIVYACKIFTHNHLKITYPFVLYRIMLINYPVFYHYDDNNHPYYIYQSSIIYQLSMDE